jgi:hypothetical protein
MNPIDRLMAWAQIVFSGLFLIGTFIVITIYELGLAHLTANQEAAFADDRKWLTGACMLILFFWFQRLRQGGIPDAGTTITQSQTSPDGTTTSVKSPAHLPPPPLPTSAPATT